jgi:4-hydroxy 2-oxovalerate aldolase
MGENVLRKKGTILGYRSDIKIMDCTVRDGGLVNNSHFEDDFVKAVYEANLAAGIDYMEIGYRASRKFISPDEFGIWKFSDEEDIRRIVGENNTDLKLSVMADTGRMDYNEDIIPKDQSVIDMIRVAAYIHQMPEALAIVKDAHNKGYETCLNLMAVSKVKEKDLDEALEMAANSEAETIYLVDSFGAMYSEEIRYLIGKYLDHAENKGKSVGIHAHNNQQLAYANTIEALIMGTSLLDATIAGFGRGAGNCPIELLLGFLKNPKFHIRPILACIRDYLEPLRKDIHWGYDFPYMLTGQLNSHPRSAIKFIKDGEKDFVKFYDELLEDQ